MITREKLKELAFFRNLSEQHVDEIAKIVRVEDCKQDAVLFRQGQPCPFICIILSGEFALQVEGTGESADEVARVGRGELLGWSPMLGNRAMTATARALVPSQVAILNVTAVHELCERDPRFGLAFLRDIALVISERLWSARRNLARLQRHKPVGGTVPRGSD